MVKKFNTTKFEVDGKEYVVEGIQDTIPSVDLSEVRGGVGESFLGKMTKEEYKKDLLRRIEEAKNS